MTGKVLSFSRGPRQFPNEEFISRVDHPATQERVGGAIASLCHIHVPKRSHNNVRLIVPSKPSKHGVVYPIKGAKSELILAIDAAFAETLATRSTLSRDAAIDAAVLFVAAFAHTYDRLRQSIHYGRRLPRLSANPQSGLWLPEYQDQCSGQATPYRVAGLIALEATNISTPPQIDVPNPTLPHLAGLQNPASEYDMPRLHHVLQ